MPLLKFRNFTAAGRKPNMLGFGMYRAEAAADIVVIEDNASSPLGITGPQNGSNRDFTTSGSIGKIFRNGALLAVDRDYILITAGFHLLIAPKATDILLVFST